MPHIYGFSVRSSGRDLNAVRRPVRDAPKNVTIHTTARDVGPDLDTMLKADVVALAESRGVDSSGTKADILARLSDD